MRISLLELILVVTLFGILLTYSVMMHRMGQSAGEKTIPWPLLIVFGAWLIGWCGPWVGRSRRLGGAADEQGTGGRWLLAFASTYAIASGVMLVLLSQQWIRGRGWTDPASALFLMISAWPVVFVGTVLTITKASVRHVPHYWIISLLILVGVGAYLVYVFAQILASI